MTDSCPVPLTATEHPNRAGLAARAQPYVGRFAPSPTGFLHQGSLVAALASWLDARAHGGQWLVRIEDIDGPRCQAGADQEILRQLHACGLRPDQAPVWQSQRSTLYEQALAQLQRQQLAYGCACTRKMLHAAWAAMGLSQERHLERPYPGTCRNGLHGQPARAWRFAMQSLLQDRPLPLACAAQAPWQLRGVPGEHKDVALLWQDRRMGQQRQEMLTNVGDFVLQRADGLWAYQLAVVVDDAAQAITHVVRGEDLADNTPRQMLLQHALGLACPQYLHTPLVRLPNGEKLSKQHGAPALQLECPRQCLCDAAQLLGLPSPPAACLSVEAVLDHWIACWRHIYLEPVTVTSSSSDNSTPALQEMPSASAAPMSPEAPTAETSHATPGQAPEGVAFPKAIKSYVLRAGRTTTGQAKAFADLGPQFLLNYAAKPLDQQAAFGRAGKVILEIGFGMGEATAHIARVRPDDNFLCCEVHEPGVGALLKRIGEQDLHNIRILRHDAVEVVDHMLPEASIDGIHIFFPDPWHKTKHNKRRLIQPALVAKLAARLKPGGYIHCATDWQPYAEQMLQVLSGEPLLHNSAQDYAPQPAYRPLTKFENRGLRLGHGVWDLVFLRS